MLGAIAALVEQDPAEGHDRIALRWIGIGTDQVGAQIDRGQGLLPAGEGGFHHLSRCIGEGCGLKRFLHECLLHIADPPLHLQQLGRHPLVTLGADASGPLHGLASPHRSLPGRADRRQVGREVGGGAGAIGAMYHPDRLGGAAELAVVVDLAAEDVHQLGLAELQLTALLVVGHRNGAGRHRDLHHSLRQLGDLLGLHRHITGAEIHRAREELTHPSPRSHRLVIHPHALAGEFLEPALVDRGGKRGPGAIEGGGASAARESQNCGQAAGLRPPAPGGSADSGGWQQADAGHREEGQAAGNL